LLNYNCISSSSKFLFNTKTTQFVRTFADDTKKTTTSTKTSNQKTTLKTIFQKAFKELEKSSNVTPTSLSDKVVQLAKEANVSDLSRAQVDEALYEYITELPQFKAASSELQKSPIKKKEES